MNEPGRVAYFLGHRATCTTSWCLAAWLTLSWLSAPGQMSWLVPLLAVATACRALKAYREVEAFKAWQKEWNELAGAPPVQPRMTAARRTRWLIALWLLMLLVLLANHQPLTRAAFAAPDGLLFLLGSLFVAAPLILKAVRRLLQARTAAVAAKQPASVKPHIVRLCLSVPRRSPSLSEATAALPAYCKQLLLTGSKG